MRRRPRWKPLAALAIVLLVGAVTICLLVGSLHPRKEFVSKPLMGYRCRFTRAADWKFMQSDSDASQGKPENYTFSAPPLSSMQTWIANRIYRQPTSTGNFPDMRLTLNVGTDTAQGMSEEMQIQKGYPEPNLHGLGKILTQRHLQIDGCPASVVRLDMMFAMIPFRGTMLLVCTPDYSSAYTVGSMAELRYSDQADREMQSIISSFRIEKVLPSARKR